MRVASDVSRDVECHIQHAVFNERSTRFAENLKFNWQDHYDYGLRNLKAVLNMAGALKRADPNMNEEAILMRALRYSMYTRLHTVFRPSSLDRFRRTARPPTTESFREAKGGRNHG